MRIGTYRHHQTGRLPRRVLGALAAAACLAASTGAGESAGALAGQPGGGAVPVETVTAGPARSLGEPAAAQDSAVSAVTATSFNATGPVATVWTRPAGATAWGRAGQILPAGFGTSYDPAAAAAPGGPLLVVAGTAPPGESCIVGGSVAIANVDGHGGLGAPRLVSDQRGTGSFDDRPAVAIGQHGMVWVAWSQGPDSDACQDVGYGDQIEVALSRDGGRTFGAPVAMPAAGGHSAFGARLVPLPGDRVAVSWTETMSTGDQAVLISVLGPGGTPGPPQQVLTGDGPPLTLPGASFYDFPAGDIAALGDGRLAAAAPFWVSGQSVIEVAAGTPGGQWQRTAVRPPAGADLLLPALGLLSPGDLRLVCAVHTRLGDRLGYDWARLTVTDAGLTPGGLATLTAAPPGPGFYEIGEELSLARAPAGLLAAVVVAGSDGASLQVAAFPAPPPPPPGQAATPAARAKAGQSAPGAGSAQGPGPAAVAALAAALLLGGAAVALAARRARRRRAAARHAVPQRPDRRPAPQRPDGRPAPQRPDRRPGLRPDGRQVPQRPENGRPGYHPGSQRGTYRPDSRQPRFYPASGQPGYAPDGRQPPYRPDGGRGR